MLQYIADQRPGRLSPEFGSFERWKLMELLAFIATEVHKGFGPLWAPQTPPEVRERTIDTLGRMDDYDTAMIYLSYHGESLGEKGLFLHGMPRAIAPEQQTRVPMAMWVSAGFAADRRLDMACLRERATRPADHDLLFSSVLGLMQVRTSLYDPRRDVFAGCAPAA